MNLQLQILMTSLLEEIKQDKEYFIHLHQIYLKDYQTGEFSRPMWSTLLTFSNHHIFNIDLHETGFDCLVYLSPQPADKIPIRVLYADIWAVMEITGQLIVHFDHKKALYYNDEAFTRKFEIL